MLVWIDLILLCLGTLYLIKLDFYLAYQWVYHNQYINLLYLLLINFIYGIFTVSLTILFKWALKKI